MLAQSAVRISRLWPSHALCHRSYGRNRGVVKEFKGIRVGKELVVTFAPSTTAKVGAALLNGIEVMAEGP